MGSRAILREGNMTPLERILQAALTIAREAPRERGPYASQARVPWREVERIREALAELGIDPRHWDSRGELERLRRAVREEA